MRRSRDIGNTNATCACLRRIFPCLSAIGGLTSQSVFSCPTKFPGMHFSIYHLFQYCTMFIFTWYTFYNTLLPSTTPFTTIILQLPSTSFYYVLNNTSQALVAVSSCGHIHISVHVLTSLSLAIACIPLSPSSAFQRATFPHLSPYRAPRAFPLELSPVDTCFLRFP
jgi:hypothetical protein